MTLDELRDLINTATTTDIVTAGRAYGIGAAKSYRLARAGEFPVQVLTIGTRYRVRTALLAADLLPQNEAAPAGTEAAPTSITSQENEVQNHGSPLNAA